MTIKSVLIKENILVAVDVNDETQIKDFLKDGYSLVRVQVCRD